MEIYLLLIMILRLVIRIQVVQHIYCRHSSVCTLLIKDVEIFSSYNVEVQKKEIKKNGITKQLIAYTLGGSVVLPTVKTIFGDKNEYSYSD